MLLLLQAILHKKKVLQDNHLLQTSILEAYQIPYLLQSKTKPEYYFSFEFPHKFYTQKFPASLHQGLPDEYLHLIFLNLQIHLLLPQHESFLLPLKYELLLEYQGHLLSLKYFEYS